jgi:hypothetical protein
MVGINTAPILAEVAPSGDVKESGLSREGSHRGMEEYVEIKYVKMAGICLAQRYADTLRTSRSRYKNESVGSRERSQPCIAIA